MSGVQSGLCGDAGGGAKRGDSPDPRVSSVGIAALRAFVPVLSDVLVVCDNISGALRAPQGRMARGQADQPLPSVEPWWIRPGALSPGLV